MTVSISRRRLLKAGGAAGAGFAFSALIPSFATASTFSRLGFPSLDDMAPVPIEDDARVKDLAMRAIDAAKSAGATYADVRLIREDQRLAYATEGTLVQMWGVNVQASMIIGVRALVGGYWGFAGSTTWSADEAARLGKEAVNQAKIATAGKPRVVDLAPLRTVASGHWQMPVEIDPTTVPVAELHDFSRGISLAMNGTGKDFRLYRWDRAFASTAGAYATQTTYRASAGSGSVMSFPGSTIPPLTAASAGWEYLRHYPFHEQQNAAGRWWGEIGRRAITDPVVGRFPVVMAPEFVASIVSATIGRATELDRMLGYRANGAGTSYLADPLELLGTPAVGTSAITVTADRTMPQGCATVAWDDEGVAASQYPLVTKGVLTDCVTTRESASWLAPYYQRHNMPVASHGSMTIRAATEPPETTTPNLTIVPSATRATVADLCAQLPEKGYLLLPVKSYQVSMDHQQLNGMGTGQLVEVRNGKLTGVATQPATFLFRAPELWKSVLACGDASTAMPVGIEYGNRPPGPWGIAPRDFAHTVSAVPLLLKELVFIPNVQVTL
jgi:TldD protein